MKRILGYLFLIIFCFAVVYLLWPSEVGWRRSLNDIGLRGKWGIIPTWQMIKNKLIERKVIEGTTTRREFEKLFDAHADLPPLVIPVLV